MIDKRMDLSSATTCWRNSFEYDSLTRTNGDDMIQPLSEVSRAVYGNYEEVNNEEKLDLICTDPEAMRMQALVIRERILGDYHPETHYYARYRGTIKVLEHIFRSRLLRPRPFGSSHRSVALCYAIATEFPLPYAPQHTIDVRCLFGDFCYGH